MKYENLAAAIVVGIVLAFGAIAVVAQRQLPDRTETDRILADDAARFIGEQRFICYNGLGDVVMVIDFDTGLFTFDLSGGLTQSGKCRN